MPDAKDLAARSWQEALSIVAESETDPRSQTGRPHSLVVLSSQMSTILASRVLEEPSFYLPFFPAVSRDWRGRPVPSMPTSWVF